VRQRGNDRMACFRSTGDYVLYLGLLNELAPLFECESHAYVLMTNHVHMLLTPRAARGASSLMKHLDQRYAQHFNRENGRTGTLWEGRFRSNVVHSESYLFNCQRYIELNPVRAGMVAQPRDYRWSSYRVNAGQEPSTFIVQHPLYLGLGSTAEERGVNYQRLFGKAMSTEEIDAIRGALNSGAALGTRGFIAEVERALGRRARPGVNGRPRTKPFGVPPGGKPGSVPGFSGPEGGAR
jgi:putative transposase